MTGIRPKCTYEQGALQNLPREYEYVKLKGLLRLNYLPDLLSERNYLPTSSLLFRGKIKKDSKSSVPSKWWRSQNHNDWLSDEKDFSLESDSRCTILGKRNPWAITFYTYSDFKSLIRIALSFRLELSLNLPFSLSLWVLFHWKCLQKVGLGASSKENRGAKIDKCKSCLWHCFQKVETTPWRALQEETHAEHHSTLHSQLLVCIDDLAVRQSFMKECKERGKARLSEKGPSIGAIRPRLWGSDGLLECIRLATETSTF